MLFEALRFLSHNSNTYSTHNWLALRGDIDRRILYLHRLWVGLVVYHILDKTEEILFVSLRTLLKLMINYADLSCVRKPLGTKQPQCVQDEISTNTLAQKMLCCLSRVHRPPVSQTATDCHTFTTPLRWLFLTCLRYYSFRRTYMC